MNWLENTNVLRVQMQSFAKRARPALSREDPVTAQMATFLLGLAVEGSRPVEARRLFQEAAGIAPATAVAEQARARGR